jgi:hypothetical protein
MGRKKRQTKTRSKGSKTPKDYSVERYGPLVLERSGRFLSLRSEWDPKDHEEYISKVRENREPFREDINSKIRQLIEIFKQYNPLELLPAISLPNASADPETYEETSHEGKESYVEYALSLALSIAEPNLKSHLTQDCFNKLTDLIAGVFNDAGWFFAMEQLEHADKSQHDLRHLSLMRHMHIRGDSFQEHHLDLVKGLFTPHDDFYHAHYGFRVEDVLRWIDLIENQVLVGFFREAAFMSKLFETRDLFSRFINDSGLDSFPTMEDCVASYDALPEVQMRKRELKVLGEQMAGPLFQIAADKELSQAFLDLLSSRFGDNTGFASFPKSPGWPTNDSVIYRRPLISHEGKYYCFLPQMLFRNLITLFEHLIIEKDLRTLKDHIKKQEATI